ncbi:MAG TPA: DNA polymerase [Candidatus Paceibacterota bacterium]
MSSGPTKRIVLLDTHAILHRAYHALPEFSSSKGEPTGALYGLISMLVRVIGELKPDYIVAAYDLPQATYRHEAFAGYKAKRPKTEEALVAQINRSRDILKSLAIPLYEAPGFEADDVLGTIVESLSKRKDLEIIIASGDMDTLQLVEGTRVRVYTLKRGLSDTILYDEEGVRARFGFDPGLLPDYKGLRGDPSDNIPGVNGIGDKTASTLIQTFGSIEELYKMLKKNPGKVEKAGVSKRLVERLTEQEEEARFSKILGEIRRDAPISFTLPPLWRDAVSADTVTSLLYELEFRSLVPRVKDLLGAAPTPESPEEEIPADEVEKVGLALWVVDSTFTEPTREDIMSFAHTKEFSVAKKKILEEVEKRKLSFVYEKIELPLSPILRGMETRGVLIDVSFLAHLSREYHEELAKLAKRIYAHAGGEFNINSPRQLGEVLFDRLGLTVKNHKKTGTGQKSTRESELEKLKDAHPIVLDILSHRELGKLLSTYIDSIPLLVDGGKRLHTTFVQTGTTTGRLSSKDPNLQNIPIKTDLGKAIRRAFIASPGYTLVALDYSQIELRVAALLSGDTKLEAIFKEGGDIHTAVAAQVFAVDPKDVTYDMRRQAKVINFGILYGMGVNALRENLGTDRKTAQTFYNDYFKTFSRLAEYLEETKALAARRGYTETYFGRRRYFEGIASPIPFVRAAAERMALNAPIQGTQADLVKLAMVRSEEYLKTKQGEGDAHLLLQVHDELVYEIRTDKVKEIGMEIQSIMEEVLPKEKRRGIPFIAKGSVGENWGELKPFI